MVTLVDPSSEIGQQVVGFLATQSHKPPEEPGINRRLYIYPGPLSSGCYVHIMAVWNGEAWEPESITFKSPEATT